MSTISSTRSTESELTTVRWCAFAVTNPSAWSCLKASRSGTRDTLKCFASATWLSSSPSSNSPARIASRMTSAIWSDVVRRSLSSRSGNMSRTFLLSRRGVGASGRLQGIRRRSHELAPLHPEVTEPVVVSPRARGHVGPPGDDAVTHLSTHDSTLLAGKDRIVLEAHWVREPDLLAQAAVGALLVGVAHDAERSILHRDRSGALDALEVDRYDVGANGDRQVGE